MFACHVDLHRSCFGMDASVKWVAADSGLLRVAEEARDVLVDIPNGQRLSIVTVVGSARQGKSFLMNALTGSDTMFRVSPEVCPCTAGADLSPDILPLSNFISLGSNYPRAPPVNSSDPMIGFVDMEGQGDRSAERDVRLATPFLLISQVNDVQVHFDYSEPNAAMGPIAFLYSGSLAYRRASTCFLFLNARQTTFLPDSIDSMAEVIHHRRSEFSTMRLSAYCLKVLEKSHHASPTNWPITFPPSYCFVRVVCIPPPSTVDIDADVV